MIGVLIREGVSDWQIFQQKDGFAELNISGSWDYAEADEKDCQVHICVKREDSGEPVIWWQRCNMHGKSWSSRLKVPAGGLYMVETCLTPKKKEWSEWAIRGDIVSHIGVGDLYVVAGQSNSAGYGKDYVYDPCELGVHILKNDGKWHLAVHPLQDSTGVINPPANMENKNTGHSLYLSFAKYLRRELGYPIGLIQTALGGSCMDAWVAGGALYENMMDKIRLAGGSVKGIVWYQGCSDACEDKYGEYYEKLLAWKEALRDALQEPELPVFAFQLNRCYANKEENSDHYWGMIREYQRRFGQLEQVYVIPTNDCAVSDGCGHISAKANLILGERLAKAALTHIYGKVFLCDAPNIEQAVWNGNREILLTFRNIYEKLEAFNCAPNMLAFTAEDRYGKIKQEYYEIPQKNQLLLKFGRDLGEECVLHCASEMNQQGVIPVDFATHLPVFSFYGVKVKKGGEKR